MQPRTFPEESEQHSEDQGRAFPDITLGLYSKGPIPFWGIGTPEKSGPLLLLSLFLVLLLTNISISMFQFAKYSYV